MIVPLISIPNELISEIQQKMKPATFCKMRGTCRQMEEFVERNRFKTKTVYTRQGMLLITVGEDTKTGFDFEVIPHNVNIEASVQAYHEKGNKFTPNSIIDPYNQLSAVCFSVILVNYSPMSERFFESYSFKKVFLPLMQKLRLQSDILSFYDKDGQRHYTQNLIIQSYVKFDSLQNYTAILASEYQPIKHMKYASLGFFLDLPVSLASMIGHLRFAWLRRAVSNNDRFVSVLEDFLEEVSINKNARGSLKDLILETCQIDELTKPSCLIDLWQGEAIFRGKKLKSKIHKLPIDDGAAIITHFPQCGGTYVVRFLKCYSRQSLYKYLSKSMFREIFKSPGVYDSFFAAKDDLTAMEALNSRIPSPPLIPV